jgi:hypothetical protein
MPESPAHAMNAKGDDHPPVAGRDIVSFPPAIPRPVVLQ